MLRDMWLRWFANDCARDPIDHPDLQRMSPEELADLPLWPLDDEAQTSRSSTMISAVTELAM